MAATTHSAIGIAAKDTAATTEATRVAWTQLVLRIALSLPLIYHGAGILFGVFAGPGLKAFSAFTHYPLPVAALVGIAEFFGGLGVLTGVLTRLAAAATALVMAGAVLLVHLPHGYNLMSKSGPGMEYALTLFLLSIAVLVSGAGQYSLVSLLKRDTNSTSSDS